MEKVIIIGVSGIGVNAGRIGLDANIDREVRVILNDSSFGPVSGNFEGNIFSRLDELKVSRPFVLKPLNEKPFYYRFDKRRGKRKRGK